MDEGINKVVTAFLLNAASALLHLQDAQAAGKAGNIRHYQHVLDVLYRTFDQAGFNSEKLKPRVEELAAKIREAQQFDKLLEGVDFDE